MAPQSLIRPAAPADVPAIVDLHKRVFATAPQVGLLEAELFAYYRRLLFENPWVEETLPSFALQDESERLVGFLGVIPRPLRLGTRRVRSVVSTALMVDPRHRDPRAALQLLEKLLSGPQELTWTDGATERTRRLWEAVGGETLPGLGIKWARVFRPCHVSVAQSSQAGSSRFPLGVTKRSLCRPVDTVASLIRPFRPHATGLTVAPIDASDLFDLLEERDAEGALHGVYTRESLNWQMEFMSTYQRRGRLAATASTRPDGRVAGWSARYAHKGGIDDVVLLDARPGATADVLASVIWDSYTHGSAAIQGRLTPDLIPSLWDQHCFGKQGSWILFHTSDPQLASAMVRNGHRLTGLDGETWIPPGRSVPLRPRDARI